MTDTPKTNDRSKDKNKPQTPLFREEAIRHRTRALFGDVVLAAPLSTWLITGLLLLIILGVVAFGTLGTVQIEGENMAIWRWVLGRSG